MKVKIDRLWGQIKKQVTKDIDTIFGATYKVWVINTKSNTQLYVWENWATIYPEIDSLVKLATCQAYIRTFQSFEFENNWLGFGRMKWNEGNNKKWTTKYRTDEPNNKSLQFLGTEIWAPDWNHCYDKGETPELFVKVYHHFNSDNLKEGILVAMPKRAVMEHEKSINSIIASIKVKIPASTLSVIERHWTPSKDFSNRIDDMNPQELERIVYS